jgi:hypothetical protein
LSARDLLLRKNGGVGSASALVTFICLLFFCCSLCHARRSFVFSALCARESHHQYATLFTLYTLQARQYSHNKPSGDGHSANNPLYGDAPYDPQAAVGCAFSVCFHDRDCFLLFLLGESHTARRSLRAQSSGWLRVHYIHYAPFSYPFRCFLLFFRGESHAVWRRSLRPQGSGRFNFMFSVLSILPCVAFATSHSLLFLPSFLPFLNW